MYTEVIFDIETQKLFDQIPDRERIEDLGVSVVSAYRRRLDEGLEEIEGEMETFWEATVKGRGPQIARLWEWLAGADRVIGFNSVRFDAPILRPYLAGEIMKLPHFDLLEKIKAVLGHRLSLSSLAAETLGETKMASGLAAVDWWLAGDEASLHKLKQYCEKDVEVTKKIYDYGLKQGKLRFKNRWNEVKEFGVDFSYPPQEEKAQLGLF